MKRRGRPEKKSQSKRNFQFSFYANADEALQIARLKQIHDPDDRLTVSEFLRRFVVESSFNENLLR